MTELMIRTFNDTGELLCNQAVVSENMTVVYAAAEWCIFTDEELMASLLPTQQENNEMMIAYG